jgi:predicted ATP-binding protein involved in virulence
MTTQLTQLKLNNIGGFNSFELYFHEKLTVLIGKNGLGKTTILKSIAILFDSALEVALIKLNKSDEMAYPAKFHLPTLLVNNRIREEIRANLAKNIDKLNISVGISVDDSQFLLTVPTNQSELNQFLKKVLKFRDEHLPLFVYYSIHNAPIGEIDFSTIDLETNTLAAYLSALKEAPFDFNRFFAWFKWQENIHRQDGNNKRYEIIRAAIYQMISDEQNTFDNLHINWRENPNGDLCIEKNQVLLNINQLSAGEKTLMALVADLARRLIIANPKSDQPLQQEGIVLIDEIDLHLHPDWQRQIIPNLQKIFPNCQFIITTHSPQIISHVKPESVFILKQTENGITYSNPEESYGKNTDRILEDLMEVDARPPKEKQRLHELFGLIQAKKLAAAKDLINELQTEIGMDPELGKAKVLLKRMEIIGK